jgi:hypothetical protein
MKRVSNYLKMRVLGALEYAQGATNLARYQAVSAITFQDEDGQPRRFTWRTIQTWWYFYRAYGITAAPVRSDKDTASKVAPEHLLEVIEQVLPTFHGKKYNIEETYLICFIDDASRVIPHGAFYQADDTPNLLDCLQTAIDKRGIP